MKHDILELTCEQTLARLKSAIRGRQYLYILKTDDTPFYVGRSNNPEKRYKSHLTKGWYGEPLPYPNIKMDIVMEVIPPDLIHEYEYRLILDCYQNGYALNNWISPIRLKLGGKQYCTPRFGTRRDPDEIREAFKLEYGYANWLKDDLDHPIIKKVLTNVPLLFGGNKEYRRVRSRDSAYEIFQAMRHQLRQPEELFNQEKAEDDMRCRYCNCLLTNDPKKVSQRRQMGGMETGQLEDGTQIEFMDDICQECAAENEAEIVHYQIHGEDWFI